MNDNPIPSDVRDFVLRHIDSIAQMEALLLLSSNASMHWTSSVLAARLYITEPVAAKVLERLHALGVTVREDSGSRYACATEELAASVGRLADVYNNYLIPVTNLIHAKSAGRIREFADAFQFVKRR